LETLNKLLNKEEVLGEISIDSSTIARFSQAIFGADSQRLAQPKDPEGKTIAPPTLIFEINPTFGGDINGSDGSYPSLRVLSQFGEVIRASNQYEILRRVREGDVITVYRRFDKIYKKQGKTGIMTFVDTQLRYIDENHNTIGINRETLIILHKDQISTKDRAET